MAVAEAVMEAASELKTSAASTRPYTQKALPIHAVIPEVLQKLRKSRNLVLQAPTGAGKTTVVPLAVLDNGFPEGGRVLVLQPRRLTCINVAKRMATLWGEPLGETVGYRIRHEAMVSNRTQIEVITEGILVRMLNQNPSLEGVSCIFFDEFHERSMDSDLSFALCLAAQRNQDLQVRLIVMSATFGNLSQRVIGLLGKETGTVLSEGRCFPVDIKYCNLLDLLDYQPHGPQRFGEVLANIVRDAMEAHDGDVLVFVPGEAEIMYLWIALNNMGIGDGQVPRNLVDWARKLIDRSVDLSNSATQVMPLYATLDQSEQDEVLQPPPPGWRKVILATPIAESALTVPGVKIVVDSGLRRLKEDIHGCMSHMRTVPVSKAAAEQRSGRAGRVSPGVCYRLWDEQQHGRLKLNDAPEIHRADLSGVVLALGSAGYLSDAAILGLPWIDQPKVESLDTGRALLRRLQALERMQGGRWALTERGKELGNFPVHPRIAHMIRQAAEVSPSFLRDACDLAALLEEKELLRGGRVRHGADLEARLDALQDPSAKNILFSIKDRVLKASGQLQNISELKPPKPGKPQLPYERRSASVLVAWAFPEMLAKAKQSGRTEFGSATFRLANGQEARVRRQDGLAESEFLAIAAITGEKVFWAMRSDPAVLSTYGIRFRRPLQHRILGLPQPGPGQAESEEAEIPEREQPPSIVVRRYLPGTDYGKIETIEDVITAMAKLPEKFPPADIKSMLWDLAREEEPQEVLIRAVAEEVAAPRAAEFEPEQLVEVACALAVSGVASEAAFAAVNEAVLPRLDELPLDSEGGGVGGLLWACTAMEALYPELLEGLAQRAVTALVEFEPRVLSEVRQVCFWAFHRASAAAWSDGKAKSTNRGFAHADFFDNLAPLAVERLSEINPISCVYLMWSFSKAGMMHQELFDAVVERVGPVANTLDRCGLTMYCWNYAYGEIENEDVYRHVAEDTLRPERMAEMAPRDISCIAWAFAKAQVEHEALFAGLLKHSADLLRDGLSQQCYRYTLKSLARDVYEGDHSAVEGAVDAFDVATLADVLWACAEAQRTDAKFLKLCDKYITKGLQQPTRNSDRFIRYPRALVKTLQSFARLSVGPCTLFQAALPHVLRQLDRLWAADIAGLTWAWAMMGPRDPWLLTALDDRVRELFVHGGGASALSEEEAEDFRWALTELGLGDGDTFESLGQ